MAGNSSRRVKTAVLYICMRRVPLLWIPEAIPHVLPKFFPTSLIGYEAECVSSFSEKESRMWYNFTLVFQNLTMLRCIIDLSSSYISVLISMCQADQFSPGECANSQQKTSWLIMVLKLSVPS